MYPGNTHQVA